MNDYRDRGYTSFQLEEIERERKKELSEEEYQRQQIVKEAELARENKYNLDNTEHWNYYCRQAEELRARENRIISSQRDYPNYNYTKSFKQTSNDIKKIVAARNITRLVHFTRIENLNSILRYGLLSRAELNNRGLDFEYNDNKRKDGQLNATCLSITFPNYGLFCKSRNAISHGDANWVVIELKPDLLWEKECVFSIDNAANSRIRINRQQSLSEKKKFLKLMFKENYNGNARSELNIPDNYTTSPQAEVLCYDAISTAYINKIAFYNHSSKNKQNTLLGSLIKRYNITPYVNKELFKARKDYKSWQKRRNYNG